ncbi:Tumor susceptibility gene 101 protein [Colletotrichum orbiculare MAFF 240422]|uniref:Tumor susceptibility gene 101 protein n=1 Tax=Colletotrichum orbiculare (strain 104-T / ATCC 96160 / CBS 514.97 / LARS 414 / MAFF 240422) TaxID=1213857 RepID=A0A484FVW5_COLOR|nr:Tumor susceptibility gene 101 protein [Colletotrichum orbiculare MAFF 240422]
MSVQQHVLNWLYSVLTSEYHDVNRAYNDVAQALSQYPSLSPRTDVHTFDNGASALLLHLSGTIPVNFRGTTYRFPVSIWVPHAYPRDAPLVYVTPTESMMVRPGQHIDPQGQVYHPYLVGWSAFWDKSTIVDFLAILRDVFAKEPPVIARPQGGRHSAAVSTTQQWCGQGPPPLPPPPPVHAPGFPSLSATRALPDSYGPPPPPPKGTGPPLPPLPKDPDSLDHSGGSPRTQQLTRPRSEKFSRYDAAPPLPLTHQASSPPAIAAGFQQQQIRRPLDPGHQFLDRTPGSHRALFASSSDQTVSRSLGVSFSREGGTVVGEEG